MWEKIDIFNPRNFYNSNLLPESNIIGNILHRIYLWKGSYLFKIMQWEKRARDIERQKQFQKTQLYPWGNSLVRKCRACVFCFVHLYCHKGVNANNQENTSFILVFLTTTDKSWVRNNFHVKCTKLICIVNINLPNWFPYKYFLLTFCIST